MVQRKPVIALVEDNPADAKMLQFALGRTSEPVEVIVLPDGRQALDFLSGPAVCDLVILDLNLPVMNGFEVLARMRADLALRKIPVIVLSGSSSREDVERCYFEGASSYVCKPNELRDILSMASHIVGFWFQCARLPATTPPAAEHASAV